MAVARERSRGTGGGVMTRAEEPSTGGGGAGGERRGGRRVEQRRDRRGNAVVGGAPSSWNGGDLHLQHLPRCQIRCLSALYSSDLHLQIRYAPHLYSYYLPVYG
ncbi:Os12g0482833 [Oryza sativa Japonica Group]|uniref:Os12g0482833 protein n=1 Tax=Oryza sativa subsp. japonica TaxID=39947 RepID=A0A0P0YA77_ORYSJ|nr:Os12g0482833 [Oryza sativa Japonica Group]